MTNRVAKNICVLPVVVAELKFRDVERHVFFADLVERAHHARDGIWFKSRLELFAGGRRCALRQSRHRTWGCVR